MGWLIALGILIGIAILPLGISVKYNASGTRVQALVGPVRLLLYPRKKKASQGDKKQDKKKKPASESEKTSGGSIKDFAPLLKRALAFLNEARGKFRVNRLEVKLILAADDPCDLAINYGRAWAAIGNIMPLLEQHLVIKKRDVEVECDFTADETRVSVRVDLTITVARLIRLGVQYGIPALREYMNILKLRKGGAKT